VTCFILKKKKKKKKRKEEKKTQHEKEGTSASMTSPLLFLDDVACLLACYNTTAQARVVGFTGARGQQLQNQMLRT
jgi:hypothetical protein